MKKRFKTKKRKTLPQLLLKALLCTAFLTVIFAFCFQEFLLQFIRYQAEQQNDYMAADMQQRIGQAAAKYDGDILMQEIRCQLSIYQYYGIRIDDPLGREGKAAIISAGFSPKCSKGAALIGKDGSIAASNEVAFMTILRFSAAEDDPANGWYVCDRKALNLLEVDSFFEDYLALASQETLYNMLDIEMETAYVNKKTHSYIPQKGIMYLKEYPEKTDPLIEDSQIKTLATKEINITVDLPGYELMALHNYEKDAEYPRAILNFPQAKRRRRWNSISLSLCIRMRTIISATAATEIRMIRKPITSAFRSGSTGIPISLCFALRSICGIRRLSHSTGAGRSHLRWLC